jgi:uncharacterized protein (TIGR03437 family)
MIRFLVVIGVFCGIVNAAPKLRLDNASVGPVFITLGQIGAPQSVAVTNAGDGSLSLSATANVPWIAASITTASVRMGLNTASLTRGKYTGIVTVSDPNAVDSPQTISVTVQVGDSVPDSVALYLPPGGSASTAFSTGSALTVNAGNFPPNGPTLSVASTSGGSFSFSNSYQVSVTAPAGILQSDYSATFSVTGGVTKTVPVTAHVTSLPIGQWTNPAAIRVAQGAVPATTYVSFANAGLGTLTMSAATGNPSWLTATIQGTLLALTGDPTGMTPGTYTATVSVASNADNGPFAIPVEMDVLTPGPAWTYYQKVVDNVLFQPGGTVAPGEWVALFGEQLTTGAPALGTFPLGKPVGGAAVFVNDQPAPVYYVSAGQIDFVIPFGTQPGSATVRVDRDGQRGNSVSLPVAAAAPRLLRLGIGDYANAQLNGTATLAIPVTAGVASQPAKAGQDVVVFYAFGLGQTVPAAVDGTPVSGGTVSGAQVVIGESVLPNSGLNITPDYAGFTPGFVGVYQINVTLPANTPSGAAIPVYFTMNGVTSNKVNIAVQ